MVNSDNNNENSKIEKTYEEIPSLNEFEDYAEKLKALSDPTRLKILYLLSYGESCACKIQDNLNKQQSNISHHLKILKTSGFITAKKNGIWVNYKLHDPELINIIQKLNNIIK